MEDLRQKCLYNIEYNSTRTHHIWWEYIKVIHSLCYDVLNEDCSMKAHQKLGLSFQETQKCVMNSFTSNDWEDEHTSNTIIDEEIEYWKKYSSGVFPAISINNRTYRG